MFKEYLEFKSGSQALAKRLNELPDFEAEFLASPKHLLGDEDFLSESDWALFEVRRVLQKADFRCILTLVFRYSGDAFPESYFKVCEMKSRLPVELAKMEEVFPKKLFAKVELDMPRFDKISEMLPFEGTHGLYRLNLCGLRDEYMALVQNKVIVDMDKDGSNETARDFLKMASWLSWVMSFFGEGLPSHILGN